jgi:hypothetical protein
MPSPTPDDAPVIQMVWLSSCWVMVIILKLFAPV